MSTTSATKSRGPKLFSKLELERVGVVIIDESSVRLQCVHCQQDWSPAILPGGHLPPRYWHCPNGCNAPAPAGA